jgi:subfamily B ATP-binding cassette protein MsbA
MISRSSYELRSRLNTMVGVLGLMTHEAEESDEDKALIQSAYEAALDSLTIIKNLEKLERYEIESAERPQPVQVSNKL